MLEQKVVPLSSHKMASWRGRSGRAYAYWAYHFEEAVPNFPGIYAYAARSRATGEWRVFYLGETENFSRAINDSHYREAAQAMGATHVLLHCQGGGDDDRMSAEMDLLDELAPALNCEHEIADDAIPAVAAAV